MESLLVVLWVLMFICIANVAIFLGWFIKYANRTLTPFEATAIIASLMSVVSVATVLFMGM